MLPSGNKLRSLVVLPRTVDKPGSRDASRCKHEACMNMAPLPKPQRQAAINLNFFFLGAERFRASHLLAANAGSLV